AARHLELKQARALVLGGTGPVGQRVALLLARAGAEVRIGSRQQARAQTVAEAIRSRYPSAQLEAVATGSADEVKAALAGRGRVIAAGAAGVTLLPRGARAGAGELKVAIDLNAVPPEGIEGIAVSDRGKERDGIVCYGAIGV